MGNIMVLFSSESDLSITGCRDIWYILVLVTTGSTVCTCILVTHMLIWAYLFEYVQYSTSTTCTMVRISKLKLTFLILVLTLKIRRWGKIDLIMYAFKAYESHSWQHERWNVSFEEGNKTLWWAWMGLDGLGWVRVFQATPQGLPTVIVIRRLYSPQPRFEQTSSQLPETSRRRN